MFDTSAIQARRNPLSKAQEQKKKKEASFVSTKRPDQVYALAHGPADNPTIFYVGIALNPATRYKNHLRAIKLGVDTKQAYEYIRYHKQKESLHMIVLDPEGNMTEEEWRVELIKLGHPLQNATSGVDVKRKKREADKHRDLLTGHALAPTKIEVSPAYARFMAEVDKRNDERWARFQAEHGILKP